MLPFLLISTLKSPTILVARELSNLVVMELSSILAFLSDFELNFLRRHIRQDMNEMSISTEEKTIMATKTSKLNSVTGSVKV